MLMKYVFLTQVTNMANSNFVKRLKLMSQKQRRQLFKQVSPTHVHFFQQYLMILVLQLKYMKGQKHSKRVK